jgi:hypothetical protein
MYLLVPPVPTLPSSCLLPNEERGSSQRQIMSPGKSLPTKSLCQHPASSTPSATLAQTLAESPSEASRRAVPRPCRTFRGAAGRCWQCWPQVSGVMAKHHTVESCPSSPPNWPARGCLLLFASARRLMFQSTQTRVCLRSVMPVAWPIYGLDASPPLFRPCHGDATIDYYRVFGEHLDILRYGLLVARL